MTRGEAVNWLTNIMADIGKSEHHDLWHYEQALSEIREMLESEPERKMGKWINHRNDMGHNIADCSECGEAMQWYDPDTRPNYCPNCGAIMKKM